MSLWSDSFQRMLYAIARHTKETNSKSNSLCFILRIFIFIMICVCKWTNANWIVAQYPNRNVCVLQRRGRENISKPYIPICRRHSQIDKLSRDMINVFYMKEKKILFSWHSENEYIKKAPGISLSLLFLSLPKKYRAGKHTQSTNGNVKCKQNVWKLNCRLRTIIPNRHKHTYWLLCNCRLSIWKLNSTDDSFVRELNKFSSWPITRACNVRVLIKISNLSFARTSQTQFIITIFFSIDAVDRFQV